MAIRRLNGARKTIEVIKNRALGRGLKSRGVMVAVLFGYLLPSTLVLALAMSASAGVDENSKGDRFPLWEAVPSKRYAVLGEGGTRQRYQWGAYVYRPKGADGGAEPCLVTASFYDGPPLPGGGLYQPGEPSCGSLVPHRDVLSARSGIVVKRDLQAPTVTAAAVAMAFSTEIYRVKIEVSPGPDIDRRTTSLSATQITKARIDPIRFLAFPLLRRGKQACIVAVEGFNRQGTPLFEDRERRCR